MAIERASTTFTLKKKCLIKIWFFWERIYHRLNRLSLGHEEDLLYFKVKIYKGRPLLLNDGECIKKGDLILELHFNNKMLLKKASKAKNNIHLALSLIHAMKTTLIRIGAYIEEIERQKMTIKALYGISILHKGAHQFGFNVIDIQEKWSEKWQRLFLQILLVVVHPSGRKGMITKSHDLYPKIIAVSKKTFKDNLGKLYSN
ncbi:hypothetical protein JOD45_002606 [Scopulibacillus daqui]|uniref:YkoP-like domain-containing protein n=1 Tax=Scopulibacillus daqui TaxID=1469162 RepID=A0ABS2Q255_9BACL|nr:hypothetical protein [Scopulibacillus daqui]MBM7646378.1 hypothetical protein [Scopulibacillus daqui]